MSPGNKIRHNYCLFPCFHTRSVWRHQAGGLRTTTGPSEVCATWRAQSCHHHLLNTESTVGDPQPAWIIPFVSGLPRRICQKYVANCIGLNHMIWWKSWALDICFLCKQANSPGPYLEKQTPLSWWTAEVHAVPESLKGSKMCCINSPSESSEILGDSILLHPT